MFFKFVYLRFNPPKYISINNGFKYIKDEIHFEKLKRE